jgi:ABC-type branched-subunit amino acid transport system substrate-binding protein
MFATPLALSIGCKGSESDKPIEIGHIHATSQSDDEFHAVEVAVEELNADSARLPQGRQIQVRNAIGSLKPDEWGAQASRLMSLNHVSGLICGGNAEDAEKFGAAVSADGVIGISTSGWATGPAQNLFTVGVSPVERGRALAIFVKEKSPKSVLVIRDPAAKSAKLAADRFATELAATPIRVAEVDASATEKPAAEAIVFACSLKTALEHRPKDALRIFVDDPIELLAAGTAADGFVVATGYHAGASAARATAFAQKFEKVNGRVPTPTAVLTYDALTIWAEAARRANSLEAAAIRDELLKRETPFDSLTGPLTFANDHTARRPIFVGRIAEGRLRDVKEIPAGPVK